MYIVKPMDWPAKIKDLRRRHGLSQSQLAARLGIGKKILADWEQGAREPNSRRYIQFARLAPAELRPWFVERALERLGADASLVLGALPPGRLAARALETSRTRSPRAQRPLADIKLVNLADWPARLRALDDLEHHVAIPLLTDAAAAGSPREISDADIEGYALAYYSWCPQPENFTCVRVRGDSMTPVLHDGAIVAIDHSQRDPALLNQRMVAARHEGGVTIKWLERLPDGALRLAPENKSHPAVTLPRTSDNPILGLVSWWWNRPLS